jgi:hypothetical protein
VPLIVVNQNGFSDFKVLLNKDDGSGDFADGRGPLDGPVGDIAIPLRFGDGKLTWRERGSTPRAVTLWKGGRGGFSAQSATLLVATNSTMRPADLTATARPGVQLE